MGFRQGACVAPTVACHRFTWSFSMHWASLWHATIMFGWNMIFHYPEILLITNSFMLNRLKTPSCKNKLCYPKVPVQHNIMLSYWEVNQLLNASWVMRGVISNRKSNKARNLSPVWRSRILSNCQNQSKCVVTRNTAWYLTIIYTGKWSKN
jgi:hypothetical protein